MTNDQTSRGVMSRHLSSAIRHWALVGCAAFLFAGCATPKPKKKDDSKTPPPHQLVGTIVSVNEDEKFVLIDTESSFTSNVGTALKSFSHGSETGVLTVSNEHRPPFMIADIVSGTPQKGDQVFQ
jgi:hypothetical protein